MYRVGLVCTNGNKFMNAKTFSDEKSARAFKKTCEKTFEGEAEFVISAYCDSCGKEQAELYVGGLCKDCFKKLQKQSPCYRCKNDFDCANCWVTRYIIGGARK